MPEKRLTIDENGEVSEEKAHIKSKDSVVWVPASGLKGEVSIEFTDKHPFKELRWLDKKSKGKKVSGTARDKSTGTYDYTAKFIPMDGRRQVARAQPQIIVDGRRLVKPGKSKAASKSTRTGAPSRKAASKRAATKRVAKKR